MIANMPAKIGAAKLVPPAAVRSCVAESRNPLLQLAFCPVVHDEVSLVQ
jgi:hypothetical protein